MKWREAPKIFAFASPKQLMDNHIVETITVNICQDFHHLYSIFGKEKCYSPPCPPSPKMPP